MIRAKKEPRESAIERWLTSEVHKCGGLSYKWVSPGNVGVPDRIIIYNGRIWFAELKTDSGRLSEVQKVVIRNLSDAGMKVRVIYGKEQARIFLHEIFGSKYPLGQPKTTEDYGIEEWQKGGGTRL